MLLKNPQLNRANEEGSALVAVIAVMLVGLLITTVIMTSVVGAVGYTSVARAGVQSQASADAGIAAARVGLMTGTCAAKSGLYASAAGEVPQYRAVIYQSTAGAWVQGCPASSAVPVKIVADGSAQSIGVAGRSANDGSRVEAIFAAAPLVTTITPSGPAIYSYSSTGFGGSGTLSSVSGSVPSVMVRHGDVVCNGSSSGADNFVVADGTLSVDGSCKVRGSIWSSGKTTLTGSADIGGNVVSSGLSMEGSAKVGGSAWSIGQADMPGSSHIVGTLSATKLVMSGSAKISGNVWSPTAPTQSGSAAILGQYLTGTGPQPISAPTVPDWVDFAYKASDWTGFTEKVISGSCDVAVLQAAISTLAGAKGVIDARACTGGLSIGGSSDVAFTNDLVIVANKFDFGGSGSLTSTANARLWLITPDDSDDDLPTCPVGADFSVGGSFSLGSTVSAMIYTPCSVSMASSTQWRGQVFAGKTSMGGSSKLAYVAMGLPGVDLSDGVLASTGGAERPLQSMRDLVG
ncbi:MAG: hypothetical protein JWP30_1059 [Homoserinimonas sp.]|nr:hypothetical protein [Homoserinimonas sp.]